MTLRDCVAYVHLEQLRDSVASPCTLWSAKASCNPCTYWTAKRLCISCIVWTAKGPCSPCSIWTAKGSCSPCTYWTAKGLCIPFILWTLRGRVLKHYYYFRIVWNIKYKGTAIKTNGDDIELSSSIVNKKCYGIIGKKQTEKPACRYWR